MKALIKNLPAGLLLLSFLLSACTSASTPAGIVTQAAPTSNQLDKPASQIIPTPTAVPDQEPSPTLPALPQGPGAEWQVVVIGDSSLWGLGDILAKQIESDLEVKVTVHDLSLSALSAGRVLKVLEGASDPDLKLKKLAGWLAEAEMVVMWTNPNDSVDSRNPFEPDGCFLYKSPGNCSAQGLEEFTADLESIWAKIFELRGGQPVILRAMDLYNPLVAPWQEAGVFEACTDCWEQLSSAARQAAKNQGVPFLSRLDAFNGPNHNEDPRLKGLIDEDGEHLSAAGNELISQLLSQMGYEPTIPAYVSP